MNLKAETIKVLEKHGKTKNDVVWAGVYEKKIPLNLFWQYIDKEYDKDYGLAQVNLRLLVVGNDWWLERHEYDGAEWWEYKEKPQEPKEETYRNIVF